MSLEPYLESCGKSGETCLPIRVLELYSGIGGMHYAFHACEKPHEIAAAIDINTSANAVYRHNFPSSCHLQRNIQSLSAEEFDSWRPDVMTLSPPCQPFTRQGLQKDLNDPRTDSFLHVIRLLSRSQHRIPYIFLENVKGFEGSMARRLLIQELEKCGYNWREFLISPSQLGIPNSRLRYYLLAKIDHFCFDKSELPITEIPSVHGHELHRLEAFSLKNYLEVLEEVDLEKFLLGDEILSKFSLILDVVNKESTHSCCFTKGYGHYVKGTGSCLQHNMSIQLDEVYKRIGQMVPDDPLRLDELKSLKLRFFTPREVANIMSFPADFSFPSNITTRQRYQVLGNSVNIRVVAKLLSLLLCTHCC